MFVIGLGNTTNEGLRPAAVSAPNAADGPVPATKKTPVPPTTHVRSSSGGNKMRLEIGALGSLVPLASLAAADGTTIDGVNRSESGTTYSSHGLHLTIFFPFLQVLRPKFRFQLSFITKLVCKKNPDLMIFLGC